MIVVSTCPPIARPSQPEVNGRASANNSAAIASIRIAMISQNRSRAMPRVSRFASRRNRIAPHGKVRCRHRLIR